MPHSNPAHQSVALVLALVMPTVAACVTTQAFYTGTKRLDEVAVLVWDSSWETGHCRPAPTPLSSIDGVAPVQSSAVLNRAEFLPGKHTLDGKADYNHSLCDEDPTGRPIKGLAPPPGTVDGFLPFTIEATMESGACYALRTEELATEEGERSWSPPFVRKMDANSVVGSLRSSESFYRWCAKR